MAPPHFTCENTVRHGFPYKPISVAFDPIQVRKFTIVTQNKFKGIFLDSKT